MALRWTVTKKSLSSSMGCMSAIRIDILRTLIQMQPVNVSCCHKLKEYFGIWQPTDLAWSLAVVDSQNALTQQLLSKCKSRDKFKELMRGLYNYPRYGCPQREGDRWTSLMHLSAACQPVSPLTATRLSQRTNADSWQQGNKYQFPAGTIGHSILDCRPRRSYRRRLRWKRSPKFSLILTSSALMALYAT